MIRVEHLTKYYGSHLAVDDVSFTIEQGHIYGFLGPNGAGKSTTMNIITGCLSATEGGVTVGGYDIFDQPLEAKRCIGYLPEHPPLYLNETPVDYLRFVGEAKGLRGTQLWAQMEDVMEKTGITQVRNRRIAQLSKGYRQRVGIAQALLGDPAVIILDEPTVGLDPIQIVEIRDLIRELGRHHTVIFSSHILSEVEAICDRIVMIAKGRLAACGTAEELRQQLQPKGELVMTTNAARDAVPALLDGVAGIDSVTAEEDDAGHTRLHILADDKRDIYELSGAVAYAISRSGAVIYEQSVKKGSLEELFLELSGAEEEKEAEV